VELIDVRIASNTTLNIQSTPPNAEPGDLLRVLTNGTGDTINVGDPGRTLNNIFFPVEVDGSAGTPATVVNIDDQNSGPHSYTVSGNPGTLTGTVTRNPTPPGPVIRFFDASVFLNGSFTGLRPGPAAGVTVEGTVPDSPVTINTQPGDNATIDVGDGASSLDDLQGPLTVNGADGATVALNVNDQQTAFGEEYTLTQGGIGRSGTAPIGFNDIQGVTVNGGGLGNTFDVEGETAGTPATINTGAGDNLVRMRNHDLSGSSTLTLNSQSSDGRDSVGYVAYTTDVYVNLQTGVGTDLAGLNGFHRVTGGQGNNILVGDGNEDIVGGTGRNLIISGGGIGTLFGSGNGDILIGANVSYASDPEPQAVTELFAILAEWTRTDLTYGDRVDHILNGDDPNDPFPLLAGATVFDNPSNPAANTLLGGAFGQVVNLYFVTDNDAILDPTDGETIVNVSGAAPAPVLGGGAPPAAAFAGNPSGTGAATSSPLQARAPALGVQAPALGTTPLVTDDLAAQAARKAHTHGLSPVADLAWYGVWQPVSQGDLSGL
jgi:hypothetical protein